MGKVKEPLIGIKSHLYIKLTFGGLFFFIILTSVYLGNYLGQNWPLFKF